MIRDMICGFVREIDPTDQISVLKQSLYKLLGETIKVRSTCDSPREDDMSIDKVRYVNVACCRIDYWLTQKPMLSDCAYADESILELTY